MTASQGPNRHEVGTVAIIVAISATVIFGFSALAVELTDMYARDRAVQTTADLAALAGAQELPDTCAAFDTALSFLNERENGVMDDDSPSPFAASSDVMRNGDLSDGEIQVLNAAGTSVSTTTCTQAGREIKVITPPRTKSFSLGAALGGASSGEVRAVARVALRGLDVSVLPLSLPSNCPSGPNYLYVDNSGGPSTPTSSPAYAPSGHTKGPRVTDVSPSSVSFPTPASVSVSIAGLEEDPSTSGMEPIFDFHVLMNDGSTLRAPTSDGIEGVLSGAVSGTKKDGFSAVFQVNLPTAVRTTNGSWRIRAAQPGAAGEAKWSDDGAVGTLIVGYPTSTGCPDPSTGDFGLLYSPREGTKTKQEERFLNFVYGLDHQLERVASPISDEPCQSDGVPYQDGILDDNDPPIGGESCIDVKPGESSSLPTNGLIKGAFSEDGRLNRSLPGGLDIGSAPGDKCFVDGDDDLKWETNGVTIVNTALSCYLADGYSLDDVRRGIPNSLRQEIAADPRFFYIPVTKTSTRPKNSSRGDQFWPIQDFRGAFITDEVVSSLDDRGGNATCIDSTDCNGLLFNGGGTNLKTIQAFTFPLDALPDEIAQPGNGGFWYGGGKDFLLVE